MAALSLTEDINSPADHNARMIDLENQLTIIDKW
jgi:hypothetical protein